MSNPIFFSISGFTNGKLIEENRTKKIKIIQVRKRKTNHQPTRTSDY